MQYVKYRCPQCKKFLQVKPSHAEIIVKCDVCKTEFRALPDANILNKLSSPIKKPFVILILFSIAITIFVVGVFIPHSFKMYFVEILFLLSIIFALISEFIIKNIKLKTIGQAVSIVIFCTMFMLFMVIGLIEVKEMDRRMICSGNMRELSSWMRAYVNDYNEYPIADKWCDLLIEGGYALERSFKCRGEKKKQCSYAINPNAEPSSPNDVVLLFETKGSWNQFGGPENLSARNHQGRGAFILFNDGHYKFTKPEQFGELNWGAKKE